MRTLDAIVKHCDKKNITLAWEYDSPAEPQPTFFGGPKYGPKVPQVDNNVIQFNGWKDEGYETFVLSREMKQEFDFCKTSRKPYDMAVMLVLLIAHSTAPKSIRIASDGDWDSDWLPAREVYKKLFGEDPRICLKESAAAQ